ncbi:hypothetical protein FA10DRAFT_43643 [Acaromyces ingoldii]|uniref:Arrestin-like N-terminal domain-containing protein n=1 Tax=Acaromyces ingoldii TaxID=215250 RepID=A0A316YXH5_9BASI|nr:hypothetical protein FA10DRAFT_43643 [Acaromyces ingoldii]PWN94220.1 hypothetical protein FA10DRAFT_43643 [Acaromyces ingoldii]
MFPSGVVEESTSVLTSARLDVDIAKLNKGDVATYEVALTIDHTSPPYERCRWGRINHLVRAELQLPNSKGQTVEKGFTLNTLPRTITTNDYSRTHRSFSELLGPVILHVCSLHLTVGGFLHIGISLPSPAPNVRLVCITLSIVQKTRLASRKRPGHEEDCPEKTVEFHRVEGSELDRFMGKDERAEAWIARLPHDNDVRPTTISSSQTPIRVSHRLEVKMIFEESDDGPDEESKVGKKKKPQKVYLAAWPIHLVSCCCIWNSLLLPPYSDEDPLDSEKIRTSGLQLQPENGRLAQFRERT